MKNNKALENFKTMEPKFTQEHMNNIQSAKDFVESNLPIKWGTHVSFEENIYKVTLVGELDSLSLLGNQVVMEFEIDLTQDLKSEVERILLKHKNISLLCENAWRERENLAPISLKPFN